MPAVSTQPSAQHQALYRATIEEAAAGGGLLMGKLVAAAAMVLHTREKASIDLRERDALAASARRLGNKESALRTQYSKSLMAAFTQTERGKKVPLLVAATMDFDQLELMDEWQVEERVAIARAHQSALLASDASLAELNTLICSIVGLKSVHPERNPLRPEAYVDALKEAIEETQAPAAMRLEWLAIMGLALGQELRDLYLNFSTRLRDEGVIAVGYAVSQTPSSAGGAGVRGLMEAESTDQSPVMASPQGHSFGTQVQRAIPTQSPVRRGPEIGSAGYQRRMVQPDFGGDETLLTLDKLRRLLAGELDHQGGGKVAAFADQFAREFDGDSMPLDTTPSGFDATVPAALEALTEMRQVDHVVQRLVQRQNVSPVPLSPGGSIGGGFIEADRAHLRGRAQGVAQALSLEVVKLMVENMARDRRLLAPIQQLIRQMEPALARLSLVDPRLFTNKQHPARVLVQEISHHSMAYVSVDTTGFSEFLAGVERAVASLMQAPIENMEPFAMALNGLQIDWNQSAMVAARNRQVAVKALETAEQRNVLAEKIARQIDSHPDASKVPVAVIDFLCGPWAQVVAQARIAGGAGSGAADKYQALISALLWSTHPALTHKNSAKLTRLIPMLLGTLRDGLETIHYPSLKASAFFEALMGFHQQAFRANQKPLDVPASHPVDANVRTRLLEDGNPWLAPEEALASNFIDLPDQLASVVSTPLNEAFAGLGGGLDIDTPVAGGDIVPVLTELPLGTWVELRINEKWVRTQLTWASPHGTLFLFTSVFGTTQSMTRRSGEKLVAAGNLRVISGAPMVDGALDAVAQQAMRNSMGLGAA